MRYVYAEEVGHMSLCSRDLKEMLNLFNIDTLVSILSILIGRIAAI